MSGYTLVIANKRYSSWSMRGWLAMKQAGVDFQEIVIPLQTHDTGAAIAKHSPSGLLPALKRDPLTVWDSLAIIEYLAESYPTARLWPEHPELRAVARSVAAEMHSGFRALRSELPMNIGATKTAHSHTAAADSDMRRIMHIWRDCLERFGGGPFLFKSFSAADIMFAPVVTRFETYGVVLDEICRTYADRIMDWPAMVEWCDTAKAEPWQIEMYDKA